MDQNTETFVKGLRSFNNTDVNAVGGKNASLGEMLASLSDRGVRVPDGFATTADAYQTFLQANGLVDKIEQALDAIDSEGVERVGAKIRRLFTRAEWPPALRSAIVDAYQKLADTAGRAVSVAVRSSATAEDLPDASFAGQQDTYLNVQGTEQLLSACKKCYASLFTDRAISYREEKQFEHMQVSLSVGVQRMVHADKGASGVMFTLDTETGFRDVVMINGAWGLGETVVGGEVNPDTFLVFKPKLNDTDAVPIIERRLGDKKIKAVYSKEKGKQIKNVHVAKKDQQRFTLEDDEVIQLSRWAAIIEEHYEQPMDIEWARDGDSGELFILQARPETVQSQQDLSTITQYRLHESGQALVSGIAIGQKAASGRVQVLDSPDQHEKFKDGDLLVAEMTDPDWGPLMKRASGIITDKGGRTAHAAIVSRELGIPAVVGCGDAVKRLQHTTSATIDCSSGEKGMVYAGELKIETDTIAVDDAPRTQTEIMVNLASPEGAFRWSALPTDGVGLARMEFIINNAIQAHPLALLHPDKISNKEQRKQIRTLIDGWQSGEAYFVRTLAEGIARIAASQYPQPTIVRLSDFKSNEYAQLLGGADFELPEENPMLGFRGAARYCSERYREAFALECKAIKRAREHIGMDTIIIMIPFCRTPEEVDEVLAEMAKHGLVRGEKGLKIYLMAEVPANVLLASSFAARCDGFSIGSNDLTQLMLGISRDSEVLNPYFDEMNPAVMKAIKMLIQEAHAAGIKIGICGQGPSDNPEFAEFLVREGIDSISLNPDTVMQTAEAIAMLEQRN